MKPVIIILLLLFASLALYVNRFISSSDPVAVTSYDECIGAGYPILETYPPQCRTSDGKTFTQNLVSESEFDDLIKVTSPLRDQLVSESFELKGEARGNWYFEASFPYKIVDDNNQELASGSVQAFGDWMTTDYVPFSVQITFPRPQSAKGNLILMKSNPSGLPQNDTRLVIPLKFK